MIELNINSTLLRKDPCADELVRILIEIDKEISFSNAILYHQFPLFLDISGKPLVANIIFVSKDHGVFIFNCISKIEVDDNLDPFNAVLQKLDNILFSKLLKNVNLLEDRRSLKFDIISTIYTQEKLYNGENEFQIIDSKLYVQELIMQSKTRFSSDEDFFELIASIEGSKGLNYTDSQFKFIEKGRKGEMLIQIESTLKLFDREQKHAALFVMDGPQKITGLAGTGKTIILAMKAALIHLQQPNAEILYTYWTKALKDTVKKFITRFYRQYSEFDPNWDKIHIMHAWGGYGLEGVYFNACVNNNIIPLKLEQAKVENPKEPFDSACKYLLNNALPLIKQYDYALLDEAQDFPKHFYQLCWELTRESKIVWAYDDFQNILDIQLQDERETFGKTISGEYRVDFSQSDNPFQTIVLYKCYRNPRKVLITAFSLGLGIYSSNKVIVQRLESNQHWESLGFKVDSGNSKSGDQMIVSRPHENSPIILNKLFEDDIVSILSFTDFSSECDAMTQRIMKDIEEGIPPEQILLICLDDRHARTYFNSMEQLLQSKGVKTFNLQNAPTNNTTFQLKNHVTLSTIYKAKGNEAGSVFIMGLDVIYHSKNDVATRNKLFTAITRSKGWVTMSGLSPYADVFIEEYRKLVEKKFVLDFKQPSEADVKTIRQGMHKAQTIINDAERNIQQLKDLGLTETQIKDLLFKLSK